MTNYFPLISTKELARIIDNENIIIFDASNGKGSKEHFDKEHISGAIHIDLETELSAIEKDPKNGGRHPLPHPNDFAETLSLKGLKPNDHVVIYDDNNGGIAAARFWWMLKSYGHVNVQVLNGGFTAAKKNGIPMDSERIKSIKSDYPISNWNLPTIDMNEVKIASENVNSLIIDVRNPERYGGISEPIDKKAGHIPSAINIYYFNNMAEDGLFKSSEELVEMYQRTLLNKEEVILHCGSGVTACHTILALNIAGFPFPKLYVGSWSEWSRREDENQ